MQILGTPLCVEGGGDGSKERACVSHCLIRECNVRAKSYMSWVYVLKAKHSWSRGIAGKFSCCIRVFGSGL